VRRPIGLGSAQLILLLGGFLNMTIHDEIIKLLDERVMGISLDDYIELLEKLSTDIECKLDAAREDLESS